jgi:hypothetical protein
MEELLEEESNDDGSLHFPWASFLMRAPYIVYIASSYDADKPSSTPCNFLLDPYH